MTGFLVRSPGGKWFEPSEKGYGREADLQQILAEHPQLIPSVTDGAIACREFQSGAGPADLVVVGPEGDVTLVECKLASNRQIRREIVGQMFDYASALWHMEIDIFDRQWQTRTGMALKDSFPGALGIQDVIAENLQSGRFKIVLAVDEINADLKRMVEYLNAMSGPETSVIAVEYTRLFSNDVEILMPRIYGQELAEAKVAANTRARESWTLEQCRDWISINDATNLSRFDLLIAEASKANIPFVGSPVRTKGIPAGGLRIFVNGTVAGSIYLYHYGGRSTSLEVSLTKVPTALHGVEAGLGRMNVFLETLTRIPEFERTSLVLRESGWSKRPNVPLGEIPLGSIPELVAALHQLSI
ncbi:hypothetical protein IWX65_000976 [Arthrobacter sp. CAN_A214]|uniref:hypothetical protein n=1 Tax=Arthrobacter sp. CAN_A214 TaxID=2787720 RepID=UPI0018CBD29F